jgi:hypothetical protein
VTPPLKVTHEHGATRRLDSRRHHR